MSGNRVVSALVCCMRTSLVLSFFLLLFSTKLSAQLARSDESIATSLYPILLNTTWENQASIQLFQIGVVDSDTSFYYILKKKYEGVKLKGKKVLVVHFKTIDDILPTQVLCVDKKLNKKIDKISKIIAGNNTLLVTNACKNEKYVMIDFQGRMKKDDFTVNQQNMAQAGLRLTNQFEEYVDGSVQWEELLAESTDKLEKEREKVIAKEQTILEQKKRINYQKMTLQEKIKMLDEQGDLLNAQADKLDEQEKRIEQQLKEIEEQENILLAQKQNMKVQESKINEQLQRLGMQRVILILGCVVLLLILATVYVLYRSVKERKKSIVALSEQHQIVSSQKDQIERMLFELTDSIRYALRIQNAVLPNEQTIKGTLPGDYFVMYKPKDIVSGDFFFVDRRGDWTLVAVADCTGHGVPGAFVSMLCISLLNEIVKQKEVLQANVILNELRDKVIHSLQQKGIQGEQMDGLDISLLLINNKTLKCQWSGANNPLYIVPAGKNTLHELKPDKRPIAIYPDMDEFTNHEIVAQPGDVFYLFTDGYSDQFGGDKGKKFMSRNFKSLLSENAHKPMSEQAEILDSTIENWKSGYGSSFEQIDDITVLGIRITEDKVPKRRA